MSSPPSSPSYSLAGQDGGGTLAYYISGPRQQTERTVYVLTKSEHTLEHHVGLIGQLTVNSISLSDTDETLLVEVLD